MNHFPTNDLFKNEPIMKTKNLRTITMPLLAASLLAIVGSPSAFAAAVLELSDGTVTVTVHDGDAQDGSLLPGAVTYIGAVGPFSINVTSGLTKPTQGDAAAPQLSLSSVDTSKDGGVLTIRFSDTDFTPAPVGGFVASTGGTVASGGNVAFAVYANSSNIPLDTSGAVLISQGPFTGAFSGDANGSGVDAVPYSITVKATITHPRSTTGIASSFIYDLTVGDQPCLQVTKEIACLQPGDNCGSFSKMATGFLGNQSPAFCYRIAVMNCGKLDLDNLSVVDDQLGDLTSLFFADANTVLPVGGSVTQIVKMAWSANTTNTVTAHGQPANTPGAAVVTAVDSAAAIVEPASLTCQVTITSPCDTDGDPNDNQITVPDDGTPCDVTFSVELCNPSGADLSGITISSPALANLGCPLPAAFDLAHGDCTTYQCTASVNCGIIGFQPLLIDVSAAAHVSSAGDGCGYDINGIPVAVNTACDGMVKCVSQPPGFQLFKSADKQAATPGRKVTYTYMVTNTGSVLLHDITVADDNGTPSYTGDDFTVCNVPTLAPGEATICKVTNVPPVTLCTNIQGVDTPMGTLITEVMANGDVKATLLQDRNLIDNTYGANAVGYSGSHSFGDLVHNDRARFQFENRDGQVVLDFEVDYISASASYPSGFGTLGLGGDGRLNVGNASDILSFDTSISRSLNQAPEFYGYTENSPAPEADFPAWEYENSYEVVVSGAIFGPSGYGRVNVPMIHNSPSKLKTNEQYPLPCDSCVTNTAVAVALANGTLLPPQVAQAVVCKIIKSPPSPKDCPEKASYWKRNPGAWPTGYYPDLKLKDVFADVTRCRDTHRKTLLDALYGKAGSDDEIQDLLREAAAALLNAAAPNIKFAFTKNVVIASVNKALKSKKDDVIDDLKDLLKKANENDKDCTKPPVPNCPRTASEWKKLLGGWPSGYSWHQTVESVFAKASLCRKAGDKTLLEALEGDAGHDEVADLLKQAVAALLNATAPGVNYPLPESDLIDAVNRALMKGDDDDLDDLADLLEEANENDDDCKELPRPNCPLKASIWKDNKKHWPSPYSPDLTRRRSRKLTRGCS